MVAEAFTCDLCGLTTRHPIEDDAGAVFCCPACREVSHLLADDSQVVEKPAVSETAVTEDITFSIGGLWCPSCAWLIQANLERESGVQASDVNFIQREARIRYNPEKTNAKRLQKRVRRLGYRAWSPGDTPHDEEEAHWLRLLISGVAAMHVMVLSFMLYFRQWTGRASVETAWLADIFQLMILVASIPVIFILGWPILRAGAASLLRGRPNTHTLIALGAFSAFGLSLRNFITGTGGLYFDTAAILLFLVALGHWFEMRAQKVSTTAVEKLWEQVPPTAHWLTAAGEVDTPPDRLPPGARIRIRPGERFPVDGIIATGMGDVDESLLTGEPEPVPRQPGDRVLAGTINLDGSLEVLATAVGADTTVGQISRLLHQALWQRAPVEQLADKLAAFMVPTAVLLSALTFMFWTRQADVETGLIHALSVLLIACPCALGIATPLTMWLGLGRAAESGVILRQTAVWERLARARHIFFDKTGTLSQRPLRLQAVTTGGISQDDLLAWVTAVEIASEHPIGQAIAAAGQERLAARQLPTAERFQIWPGQGVSAVVEETEVFVGNGRLRQSQNLGCSPELNQRVAEMREQGMLV
ncbi:MAG: heavy metal translocating P-type ATPase, partial [Anaerolineae bacterium]